ncbi:ABC transporter ATP-binding protein [Pseudonocardia abyssalis]|uniref:ABC transporter ATP-binding protein n=1 Tax=Pseudonocardia abyssalis TaxID=2792008 RepID=A0ABS6UPG4_9PSEU|nr:ABC transporter ATP-binding protein [Pseudonocardia abyssalis]MBW0115370.1 ABC transporter ATP-binding protein [Pseudonocardia abyssalis]MBW0134072.1 ABC transporter ATP-binding protein [Pseudonocardia abyssalis]
MSTGTDAEAWRGVATEDDEDLTRAAGLRLQRRARSLVVDLVRPHRRAVSLAVLLLVLENAVMLAGPLLVALAIDTGVPAAVAGRPAPLAWTIAGYAACGLAGAGLRAAFLVLSGRVGQDLLLELRRRVFAHGQRLSLDFHESYTSGRLISRLTSDLDSLGDLLERGLDGLLGAVLSLVGISVLLVVLDPLLALIVFAGFVPLVFLTRWFQRSSRAGYRRTRTTVARLIVHFVESMNGIRAVQSFRRERRSEAIMDGLGTSFRDANVAAFHTVAWYVGCTRAVGNLTLAAVLLAGGLRVVDGTLALGALTAFLLYLRRFYDPLDDLAQFFNAYQSAAAALEKISTVLDTAPGVEEPERPVALPTPVRGALDFDRVRFAYRRAPDRVVLPEFSLRVPAGQTIALVGATGAGKSSLAKLAARFYDPTAGAVRLDGVDLRDVADADLRDALVMITQEAFLFSGSVADNIAMGRPSATRAQVLAAADAVGARGFVEALPDGFDTDVRKRGGRLSAGQRQLVSLARVVLADPAVVLLDEATSSLDVPSERAVQDALETVLAGRTALIIAHRLSTVLIADRVLVMADGVVVQDGTPEALLAGDGEFAALHAAWRASLA